MKHYGQRWNYKSKGPAKTFNGITITRDRVANTIAFSLPDYVKGIFTRFVPDGHPVRLVPVDSQDTINALTVAANDSERAAMKDKAFARRSQGVCKPFASLRKAFARLSQGVRKAFPRRSQGVCKAHGLC